MDAVLRDGLLLTQVLSHLRWQDVYLKFVLPCQDCNLIHFSESNLGSARLASEDGRIRQLYGHYVQAGEVLTQQFGTKVYASFTESMLHVSFTHPAVTLIARFASVNQFWGRCILQSVTGKKIFEPFPARLFGDTTIPAYDQLIISNGEYYIDLVTDLSNIVALETFRLRCPHPVLWT